MINRKTTDRIITTLYFKSNFILGSKCLVSANGMKELIRNEIINMRSVQDIHWTLKGLWRFIDDSDIIWIEDSPYSNKSRYISYTMINWCKKFKSNIKIIAFSEILKGAEKHKTNLLQEISFDHKIIDPNYKSFEKQQ